MGFLLLDGVEIVWFGPFDQEPAKEVAFRLKLLLQNVHNMKKTFENETARTLSAEQLEFYRRLWNRLRIEVFVSGEVDKKKVEDRLRELTKGLETPPWVLLNESDIQASIKKEYENIGEV